MMILAKCVSSSLVIYYIYNYTYIENRKEEEFYVSLAFVMPCLTCFIINNIILIIALSQQAY